jgi:glycine betaine/proline transport system ATP-binding protein
MKDGAVVQAGTPEELVLHPATDYVREFTRAVARAKVVKAGSVMSPAGGMTGGPRIAARTSVAEAAPLFRDGTEAVAVTDAGGEIVGRLDRATVVDLMLGG